MSGWPDFSARASGPEWMDVRDYPLGEFEAILADLEAANRLTFAAPPTLAFLRRLTKGWPEGAELRVADLGYGEGAMLRRIHRWAVARGLRPKLTGIDMNPRCRALAEAHTPAAMGIEWHEGDLFGWEPAVRPHAVISSLFAHHLETAEVVRLLRWQEGMATDGWFVNDLHRHWFAWGGFRAMAWAMRWHPCVRHDGALSVRRGFRAGEWRAMLEAAGVRGAELRWHPLFRLCVGRLKAGA
ncbi:methyltransferase type 12 [Sandaracinobacter sp. RS1-74]|uniref:methyltransferase type 12 n=1 Tax=Sandaracinobacteroides sayramensis TaxID=2913411 RepID=UPI001EDB97BE|nr:methyltransferase type 12 [Sandaracinobacteroides sayramensis]MCG2842785.1 methyltransferase type 12 [Sandaracinobacteroides sayramensis]